jgi:hypothetical protein
MANEENCYALADVLMQFNRKERLLILNAWATKRIDMPG